MHRRDIEERDREFLSALEGVYEAVTSAPPKASPKRVRKICSARIQQAFALTDIQIKGSELLPYEKNTIFIYNHLRNHPYYTEDEGFQITLDSHFISSLILDRYYQDPGVRVARHSLANEINHRAYYDRLDYIRVYAQKFVPDGMDKKEIKRSNKGFYTKAIAHLEKGFPLVFSPEGNSYTSQDSPGIFRYGIFKLACKMDPQPLIVPLVMANFDQLASKAVYRCEIKPPFKMSDLGITNHQDPNFPKAVEHLNEQYKLWVKELRSSEDDFESEITALEARIQNHKNKDDLVVFYGSSTLRLWKELKQDFPSMNTLNLGFGGAFIDDLSKNFDRLFTFKAPKAIVLYLGGNDLSLGWTAEKIVQQINQLIEKIHHKYPGTAIVNLSIKPSMERFEQLDTLFQINRMMAEQAKRDPLLVQIDYVEAIFQKGGVKQEFFLQDGLHFNTKGYQLLKKHLDQHFFSGGFPLHFSHRKEQIKR